MKQAAAFVFALITVTLSCGQEPIKLSAVPACNPGNSGMIVNVSNLRPVPYLAGAVGEGTLKGMVFCDRDKWIVVELEEPLKCEKYQHIERSCVGYGTYPNATDVDLPMCIGPTPPPKCVDDTHKVTEREWRDRGEWIIKLMADVDELQERVKLLEGLSCGEKKDGIIICGSKK